MTPPHVSDQAYVLFVGIFRQAAGQIAAEPGVPTTQAVLQRSRELLPTKAFEIREDDIPEADIRRFNEIINDFLERLERYMQHFNCSWQEIKKNFGLFEAFVRDVLQ